MSTIQLGKEDEKSNEKINIPNDFGKNSQITWRDFQGLTWMFDEKL